MYIALYILAIVVAILLHEAGHFGTAKAFGIKAEKFFIGFGPTLWSTRRGETEYGVKAIPAGGFVKIAGMTPFEQVDHRDHGRYFYEQAAWKRLIVLAAGSIVNILMAVVLLFAALAFVGLPAEEPTTELAVLSEGAPAAEAGLQERDVIVAVDGVEVATFDAVRAAVEPRAGDTITVTVLRGGERVEVPVTLDEPHPVQGPDVGFLGVAPVHPDEPLGILGGLEATFSGDLSIFRMAELTVDGLVQVFSFEGLSNFFGSVGAEGPRDPEGLTSLVGAGQVVNSLGSQGDVFAVLVVLAQLCFVLGLLNLLPLPPLDGGHVAVLLIEQAVNGVRRLRGRRGEEPWRLNPDVITPVAVVVLAFFVVISFTAIYLDITNPASVLVE